MAEELRLRVNERVETVATDRATPLLYVLAGELGLKGPRFGCGLAQCGSCSVLVDGVEIRSCVTPVGAVEGKAITTLEGLPALYARQRGLAAVPDAPSAATGDDRRAGTAMRLLLQRHDHQGFRAAGPRGRTEPTREIRQAMNGHLCRCGSYPRMMKAIKLASRRMAEERR